MSQNKTKSSRFWIIIEIITIIIFYENSRAKPNKNISLSLSRFTFDNNNTKRKLSIKILQDEFEQIKIISRRINDHGRRVVDDYTILYDFIRIETGRDYGFSSYTSTTVRTES